MLDRATPLTRREPQTPSPHPQRTFTGEGHGVNMSRMAIVARWLAQRLPCPASTGGRPASTPGPTGAVDFRPSTRRHRRGRAAARRAAKDPGPKRPQATKAAMAR